MLRHRRPWQEELEIIDRTMKAISSVTDPEELVSTYWDNIGELLPIHDYVALSRRGIAPPNFLITRSSRFAEEINPWKERDRLPILSGGLLGEIAYAERPMIIDDLPSRLRQDDPAHFYLQGFSKLISFPQYDGGKALNTTIMLLSPGEDIDSSVIPMLHWQSGLFGRGTQNLVLRNQLADALAIVDRELRIVGAIQRTLLPQDLPALPGYSIGTDYVTSARAGGDYYDFFPLAGGSWGVFIADVSGHGTPAAVLMAITHALAHAQPGTHTPPSTLLEYLNERLAGHYTRDGTFVTAFYSVLDPDAGTLTYSAAGHNPPRLVREGRVISLDQAGMLPLGIIDGQKYRQATVTLQRGDLLLLYTDGITEAMAPITPPEPRNTLADAPQGRTHAMFGLEGLDRVLLESGDDEPTRIIARIRAAVADFTRSAPPTDDQTLIAIRRE